ncbi:porphobilinogen deaminase [Collybia nuda]|uniref:hydroxymethylbilane synthase n=1 Tax=Collybia nuda TaxID=64659 RepID=A0A9P5XRF8_9AGAR|nr:porphobilinogen deaminase [Collybia nuda]
MTSTNTSTASSSRTFTLASRASQLAQIQTNIVLASLQARFPPPSEFQAGPRFATSFMATAGDKNQSQALYLVGGKAFWTKELEVALNEGAVDMIIHSLKDVPTTLPDGLVIGAILQREDPADSLVVKSGAAWKSLEELPEGSVIGTSSVRRVAQLKRKFPGLKFLDVRGNLNTRLAKLDAPDGPYAALILAKAGLVRLGMSSRITADLNPPTLYHAVSQGALGVEVRGDDTEALELCRSLTHWETEWMCLAERACLRVLEGGCSVPIGVTSNLEVEAGGNQAGFLTVTGCVTAIDGNVHVEHSIKARVSNVEEAEDAGKRLAKVLIDTGAKKILDDINIDRDRRVVEAAKADATAN